MAPVPYPSMPRILTTAENAAITAQCIRRVYDEHDREDGGRPIRNTPALGA